MSLSTSETLPNGQVQFVTWISSELLDPENVTVDELTLIAKTAGKTIEHAVHDFAISQVPTIRRPSAADLHRLNVDSYRNERPPPERGSSDAGETQPESV